MSKGLKIALILAAISLIAGLVAIFIVANNFFMGKFPEQRTIIGGTEVSDKNISDALVAMNAADGLQMVVNKEGNEHVIPISNAVTRMYERSQVEKAKSDISFFDYLFHNSVEMPLHPMSVIIDEKKLKETIETSLPKTKYKTSDAYFDSDWNLIDEVQGDDINYDDFIKKVVDDINNGAELSYKADDYYFHPAVKSSDPDMKETKDSVQKYKSLSITFDFGKKKEIITSEKICSKLSMKKGKVKLDTSWTKSYIRKLAKKYNTLGKERKFKTTKDGKKTVKGGALGWWMDENATLKMLNTALKKKKSKTIKPKWFNKGAVHGKDNDIGKSYVEVSIARQHVWVYVKGKLKLETDCVTGIPNKERMTHPGCHFIYAKQRDRWLGTMAVQGYHTHVDYFMPFNGGEGLHDAPWRGAFGGNIYRGGGSHGCVNLPPSKAAEMYNIVWVGMPVIVYN